MRVKRGSGWKTFCAGIERVEERLWVEIGCGMRVERGCGRRSCGKKRLQVERGVAGGEREVVGVENVCR